MYPATRVLPLVMAYFVRESTPQWCAYMYCVPTHLCIGFSYGFLCEGHLLGVVALLVPHLGVCVCVCVEGGGHKQCVHAYVYVRVYVDCCVHVCL